MADNCPVNIKVAELLGIPHIGCKSHKLHLEVKRMITKDVVLSEL